MTAFKWRLAAALTASALAGVGIATAAAPQPRGESGAAAALAGAPNQPAAGAVYPMARARPAAAARGAAIPLPAGGTFNGIRWELSDGTVDAGMLDATLAYNAACQWLRAWRDGRDAATALKVLARVPDWPALRDTESGDVLAMVAAEAAAGGGELATAVLVDCDASHAREVAYATRLGLTPST